MTSMFYDANLLTEKTFSSDQSVHPSAMVYQGAKLGRNVVIGPHATIGPNVSIGEGTRIGAGAVISGRTEIGSHVSIYPYATLGAAPQDLKYKGEDTRLVIGDHNQIREYVNISLGTEGGGGLTSIGDHNLIMAFTHIAHDVKMANHCIIANGVQIAGHVEIADHAVFGGMSGGHQFCRFGPYTMVAAGAIVVQDVAPYCMVHGDRATINGLNVVGLRRGGFSKSDVDAIKEMYRITFREHLTLEDASRTIKETVADSHARQVFCAFLDQTQRGLCR